MADLSNEIATTHTLEEFVSRRFDDQITYRNLSILEVVNGEEWTDNNLITEYLPELQSICVDVQLSPDQYRKYKYCPDLLAYDVYGSTQLDFIILKANDMIDPKEFNLRTIKLPYRAVLNKILSDIYNANGGYIDQNRSDLKIFN